VYFTLAAALLLTAPSDAEIAKALRNLAQMHAIASTLEVRRAAKIERPLEVPNDPWGTPYRIDADGRIVSAGSDAKFEEDGLPSGQFAGTEGDAVFANGARYRSNRNWLDMAAMDAVRQWTFQPGTLDGEPTDVIFHLTINFQLN
jgi:hypothetical protein